MIHDHPVAADHIEVPGRAPLLRLEHVPMAKLDACTDLDRLARESIPGYVEQLV